MIRRIHPGGLTVKRADTRGTTGDPLGTLGHPQPGRRADVADASHRREAARSLATGCSRPCGAMAPGRTAENSLLHLKVPT